MIELGSVLSSDPNKLSVTGRFFEEKDLTSFLESPDACLMYVRNYLIPFIEQYTAEECRQMINNPSQDIVNATKRVVAQIANGDLDLLDEWQSPEQRDRVEN